MNTMPSLNVSLRTWPPVPFQVPLNFAGSCAIKMKAVAPSAIIVVNIAFFKGESPSVKMAVAPLPYYTFWASASANLVQRNAPEPERIEDDRHGADGHRAAGEH